MPQHPQGRPALVTGMMVFRPVAGVVMQTVHYLQALRRLGFDPMYVERTGWWFLDPQTKIVGPDPTGALRAVKAALELFGFGDRWALRIPNEAGEDVYGADHDTLRRWCGPNSVLLNVTGTQYLSGELLDCGHRLYVESDPFVAQFDVAKGDDGIRAHLDAHTHLFTFGETIGEPTFPLPLAPYTWHPTRQAVDIDHWATTAPPAHHRFTTVTSWHNEDKNRSWDGTVYYWTKGREFERFLGIGRRYPGLFEMAVTEAPEAIAPLSRAGWRRADAHVISSDIDRYRRYIQDSFAEVTVARDQYVRPRTGWFSDRSACYLAAGRPVICQETGFSSVLPTGQGLYGFSTVDELAAAIESVLADPVGNQNAAREIARAHFEGTDLVRQMLETAGAW